jgi:hypothetical protein
MCPLKFETTPMQHLSKDLRYGQKSTLTLHIERVHGNKKLFKCDLCDFSALLQAQIKRHIERVHKISNNSNVTLV